MTDDPPIGLDENLLRMANRIADFFEAMPDRNEAVDGVAQHLRRFWTPAMRGDLARLARGPLAEGLHPLVRSATERLQRGP